ncbi:MAG: tRNA (adenosine(37)-N6)-threonylcarbamoyltransferase complex dimerization subunit type 1 TsaB [Xanthomonadaceae bacterium]|nr:tRNA (adenosine(37)-N6)-threonylcarbamoyltransferase complex dimerization subunit type 1 TsaB [Xanthomonadaceae bacterium]
MKLIALETSTEACSVAVLDEDVLIERFEVAPRRHAELTLPWAEALLAEAGLARKELNAVAVGRGPGAFTGVRLGVSLAQGMALALDIPAIAVSTLAALAMRAPMVDGQRILAAIDARMGEVYWATFEVRDGLPQPLGDERVGAPESVEIVGDGWHGVGTGFAAQEGQLAWQLEPQMVQVDAEALPHAADIARLAEAAHARGEAVAPERLEPAYLRNQVALTLAEQQALRDSRQ